MQSASHPYMFQYIDMFSGVKHFVVVIYDVCPRASLIPACRPSVVAAMTEGRRV